MHLRISIRRLKMEKLFKFLTLFTWFLNLFHWQECLIRIEPIALLCKNLLHSLNWNQDKELKKTKTLSTLSTKIPIMKSLKSRAKEMSMGSFSTKWILSLEMVKSEPIMAPSISKTNLNTLLFLTTGYLCTQSKPNMMISKLTTLTICSNNQQALSASSLKSLASSLFKGETLRIGKKRSETISKRMEILKLLFCSSISLNKKCMVNWRDSWQRRPKFQVKLSEDSHCQTKYPQETCQLPLRSSFKWMLK